MKQDHRPDEVLVVVRRDDEATHALLERIGNRGGLLKGVAVCAPGVVAALNSGWAASKSDLVAITDDDAVPAADWLRRIVARFAADPELGGVGGRDRLAGYPDTPVPSESVGRIQWYGRPVGDHHLGTGHACETDVLKGVNVAFRRSALERVGFDTRLKGSGAQAHWEMAVCLGIKRAGWRLLYDPNLLVDHDEGPRFGDTERGFENLAELVAAAHNQAYAMIRWLPPWRKPVVLAYELVIGSRIAPGLVTAVEQGMRTGRWGWMLRRLRAATRGRIDAIGTYVDVLRDRSQ
jgi:GT2 family glycosyltransferase